MFMGCLFQVKYCKRCEANTYHRYLNPLRNPLIIKEVWECVSCGERLRQEIRRRQAI